MDNPPIARICSVVARRLAIRPFRPLLAAATILFLSIPTFAQSKSGNTPPVEVREIHLAKDRPDKSFPKTRTAVTFWVKDTTGTLSSIVSEETEITTFRDDAGANLIAAHERAIEAWTEKKQRLEEDGHFVSTGRSRDLYHTEAFGGPFSEDASGFYLTIESWGLPSSDATALRMQGTVTYLLALHETAEQRLSDITLAETETIDIAGHSVELANPKDRGEQKQFTAKSPLRIETFDVRSQDDESVGGIRMTVNGQPVVNVPAEHYKQPVTLVISYNKPKMRRVEIDRSVSVGLP